MRIIGREIIDKFKKRQARSRASLDDYIDKTKNASWNTFSDIRKTFNSVDSLGDDIYCFNIGGNNYRLEAKVKIKCGVVRIIEVLTHAEYSKKNKKR